METEQGYVLVVDDIPDILKLLDATLKFKGYRVITARDGQEALEAIQEEKPALVIADILMPKMDGFEVLEKIKGNPKTKDIPVILLTNLNQQEDVERGMELGANDFLIKAHFMPSEVVGKIKKLLNLQA